MTVILFTGNITGLVSTNVANDPVNTATDNH